VPTENISDVAVVEEVGLDRGPLGGLNAYRPGLREGPGQSATASATTALVVTLVGAVTFPARLSSTFKWIESIRRI
jgi:hypothetical protein